MLDSRSTEIGLVTLTLTPLTAGPRIPAHGGRTDQGRSPRRPVTLEPGDYTLKLTGDNASLRGSVNYAWTSLDYVLLGLAEQVRPTGSSAASRPGDVVAAGTERADHELVAARPSGSCRPSRSGSR